MKSFLQLVYMLLYYPTLQHAFIIQFVLRKYSCLLFLFKEFAFSHFFSKIAQESRHSIKHCAKLFLFISRYLFRKIFWKVFYQLMGLWIVSQNRPGDVGLSSKRFLWYQLEKTWIFCFVCQACMAKLTITYFMDIVSLERKCHLAFRIQYTWYFYKAKDYSVQTLLPAM